MPGSSQSAAVRAVATKPISVNTMAKPRAHMAVQKICQPTGGGTASLSIQLCQEARIVVASVREAEVFVMLAV